MIKKDKSTLFLCKDIDEAFDKLKKDNRKRNLNGKYLGTFLGIPIFIERTFFDKLFQRIKWIFR